MPLPYPTAQVLLVPTPFCRRDTTKTLYEQFLPQILKPKRAVEKIREAKELMAELTLRREVNPAPAPPPVDPKVTAFEIIAKNPSMAETCSG
jgi:hypothetical protein